MGHTVVNEDELRGGEAMIRRPRLNEGNTNGRTDGQPPPFTSPSVVSATLCWAPGTLRGTQDRKSTRLNSSH